jgi:hypothetical protein
LLKDLSRKLQQLGIMVWQPRFGRHPLAEKPQNVRCLVMLQGEQSAQPKILTGMLGVLELAKDQMQVVVMDQSVDQKSLLQQYRPEFVLQLGMDLPLVAHSKCIRTYSPEYLAVHTQHKGQAYKDLLKLRAMLHGAS